MQSNPTAQTVQIEISLEKFEELLCEGHICAAHLRCLNPQSKTIVRELCLQACRRNLCGRYSIPNQFDDKYRIKQSRLK